MITEPLHSAAEAECEVEGGGLELGDIARTDEEASSCRKKRLQRSRGQNMHGEAGRSQTGRIRPAASNIVVDIFGERRPTQQGAGK